MNVGNMDEFHEPDACAERMVPMSIPCCKRGDDASPFGYFNQPSPRLVGGKTVPDSGSRSLLVSLWPFCT
jgi:hypothetical protein